MAPRRRLRRLAAHLAAALLLLAGQIPAPALADDTVAHGFLTTVFGTEARPRSTTYVRKFVGTVSYTLISTSHFDRRGEVRAFIAYLGRTVRNLRFHETADVQAARLRIYLVNRADYAATIRATAWRDADTAFLESNDCATVLAARPSGIVRALVYLVADDGGRAFSHCMAEEITQSLGPVNDSDLLAGSLFNDRSKLTGLGRLDWLILGVLYHERIRPGMREADVRPLLPAVIDDVLLQLPADLLARPLP